MNGRRRRSVASVFTLALAVGVAPFAVAACAITDSDSFELIPSEDVLHGLDQSTTTSTSTTTTTTVPTRPTIEPPISTTTLSPVQTAPVDVYFVIGLDQLQRQTVQFSFPVEPLQVLAQLEDGPVEGLGVGLRSAVRPNLTAGFVNNDGTAEIDLRRSVLNRTGSRDQNLAIAQLVLTMARLPGVGQVSFTVDGEPERIPVPPTFTLSEPGEPLSYSTFAVLLTATSDDVPPTTSSPPVVTAQPPRITSPTTSPPDPPPTEPPDDDPGDDDPPDAGEPDPAPGDTAPDDTAVDDTTPEP